MLDFTNPIIATVIGVVIGFVFSTITWVIQSFLARRGKKKAAYIRLNGVLSRIEAHSGSREDRQLSEAHMMELESIIADNADVLDTRTLDLWFAKSLEVVVGPIYKINQLGSFTSHVRELSKELREDC